MAENLSDKAQTCGGYLCSFHLCDVVTLEGVDSLLGLLTDGDDLRQGLVTFVLDQNSFVFLLFRRCCFSRGNLSLFINLLLLHFDVLLHLGRFVSLDLKLRDKCLQLYTEDSNILLCTLKLTKTTIKFEDLIVNHLSSRCE